MKKFAFFAVCVLAAASCKNEQPRIDALLAQQKDSLNQIISQKDNELNDLMTTFNEIEEGFREINEAQ